ncbi:hypothetical protein N7491_010119 [Penicillium cf. griseofulvum]|uniref:Small monomeric GTPase n=1 Tax=Penicillium cf. griseofulvum TaxID=2972120 RepID=A0A9W9MZ97_9EURO|nr:hypothetical protein N7472_000452 [Penicillium cf. griseofulvum]KAJ5421674.1 hypothetical protein N7491_010119 [Penicillium cf. griseofulvum]KAJ5424915.1 hypothetical protein N7445_010888 [Penicillium cf. griseofulvum]
MDKISITICGDGGCGKSSITMRLVRSQWVHEYDPTIEDSYTVTRNVDGHPYVLSITDTAGQEEYRGLWSASTLNSDAFLLVYDITNHSSLETLDHFMDLIHLEAEQRIEDNQRLLQESKKKTGGVGDVHMGLPPPVKIVAGNKCDLKDDRVVTSRDGLEYARKHGCGFMETSARETVNIEETFARMILSVSKEESRANNWIDLVRRVVEARRLQSQHGALSPQCAEPSHTLPTADAITGTRSRRSRAWEFIKHRKATEPTDEGQERSDIQRTEKHQEGQRCYRGCVCQLWCFHCSCG